MATSVKRWGAPVKVSVIMAAYNMALYLEEALRSVLAQRGVAFELLVGDDGSTDGTWGILHRYQGDPRVRAWRWTHRGAGATRNRLMAKARGRYLAICDADDVALAGHLAALSVTLDRHPTVGVVYGDLLLMTRTGQLRRRFHRRLPRRWDLLGWRLGHQGTMFRHALIRQVGGYRTDLSLFEDVDLFFRLMEVTTFRAIKPVRYAYRQHASSLMHRFTRSRRWRVTQEIRRRVIARRYGYRVPW